MDGTSRLGPLLRRTGGGVVLSAANWATMRPGSVIVGLTAAPETLGQAMAGQSPGFESVAVSDDDTGMVWGDECRLCFWLPDDALRSGRFAETWMLVRCS